MAKKRKHTPKLAKSSKKDTSKAGKSSSSVSGDVTTGPNYPSNEVKFWRETVEGLVVAIVLALLIRGFEAEAFVIPTGSMAPTLRGQHKDVRCEQCGYEYAAGASNENQPQYGRVIKSTCTVCAYPQVIPYEKARDATFSGDRILVNKFSYDPLGKPERFDVIVFKNPNDAKQNYIKRLCGLPGETVKLFRGDIYVKPIDADDSQFVIARKPPKKQLAMMQPVHDTQHIPAILDKAGLPPRWQAQEEAWTTTDTNRTFAVSKSPDFAWLRYRHIVPDEAEWDAVKRGVAPMFQGTRGELIADTYAYNSFMNERADGNAILENNYENRSMGKSWVGDIAVEADLDIESDSGELLLDLVEGGWRFQCLIDVATGKATLSIQDPAGKQRDFDEATTASANTLVKGTGSYRVLFSNVDSQLRLWINDKLVDFDSATTYRRSDFEEENLRPFFGGPDRPTDLAPAGIAAKNMQANVSRLRIHRDKYYIAVSIDGNQDPKFGDTYVRMTTDDVRALFRQPETWASSPYFDVANSMRARFDLKDFDDDTKDQFFPMGDNSPQSHDARIWSDKNYVERQFLIGEAVLIYYPHPWCAKVPGNKFKTIPLIFYPKFSRMGLIR